MLSIGWVYQRVYRNQAFNPQDSTTGVANTFFGSKYYSYTLHEAQLCGNAPLILEFIENRMYASIITTPLILVINKNMIYQYVYYEIWEVIFPDL